jgi:deoxyribose-phosphate aldolase
MFLKAGELPSYIDVSCVRADVSYNELEQMATIARQYGFIAAFAMPDQTARLKILLEGSSVLLGGAVGFPSGADTKEQKIACAKYMMDIGCAEIDMVINLGALISGDDKYVQDEIADVVKTVHPLPVKTILEVSLLTDEQVVRACNLAVEAGVTFVKTGTGWASKPTTVEIIRLMKNTVGDQAKVKAAGGVRSLQLLEEMYDAGCRRFGISLKSSLSILKEAYEREGKTFILETESA